MQRAAVSIVSNIAEGYRRNGLKDYIRFLINANSSAAELEAQLEICKRIFEFRKKDFLISENLNLEVIKMLNSLISKLYKKLK